MMAVIHSLKCTLPFSFAVPLLSLAVTAVALIAIRCHFLSIVVPLVVTSCHLLSLIVPLVFTRCTTRCHSLSIVFIHCHLLSLDVPLVCLLIKDPIIAVFQIFFFCLFNQIFDRLCYSVNDSLNITLLDLLIPS